MNLIQEIQTLAGLPRILSRDRGSSVALIIENRKINYQELDELSNRVANALIEAGVVSGDRIALLARDSVASVTMLFGVAKAKAILVNINWRLAADEIANTLRDATPRLLFVDEEFMRLIPEINARMDPAPQYISLSDWGKDAAGTAPNLSYDADDVVVQIYTSGTTGHP
jgi:acyl-CoA synthetase (AMP-forming)/AMP-acid ligase II